MKNFHSRVICPQNTKLGGGQTGRLPHAEQATGQGIHCKEILFTPRCSPRAREFPRLVNFFVPRTVAELRGVKIVQFSDFGPFSPYKTPKTYLPVTSLQPRGYIAKWLRFFPCGSRRSRGRPSAAEFYTTSDRGELENPKLAQIFAYGKWLFPYSFTRHVRSALTMSENA